MLFGAGLIDSHLQPPRAPGLRGPCPSEESHSLPTLCSLWANAAHIALGLNRGSPGSISGPPLLSRVLFWPHAPREHSGIHFLSCPVCARATASTKTAIGAGYSRARPGTGQA